MKNKELFCLSNIGKKIRNKETKEVYKFQSLCSDGSQVGLINPMTKNMKRVQIFIFNIEDVEAESDYEIIEEENAEKLLKECYGECQEIPEIKNNKIFCPHCNKEISLDFEGKEIDSKTLEILRNNINNIFK